MEREDEVEEMDTANFSEAKALLREKAHGLLVSAQFLRNRIKYLQNSIEEASRGPVEPSDEQVPVAQRILVLEEEIIKETSAIRSKQLALEFAQMSLKLNSQLALDPSVSSSKLDSSDSENGAITSQMEQMYQLQTKYLRQLSEVEELEETTRELQEESLECILESRVRCEEMTKLRKQLKLDEEEAKTREELNFKEHIKKGIRVRKIISRLFEELILCSQLNWNTEPGLKDMLMKLRKMGWEEN